LNPSLPRLLQLASPALPVGAYTYSQGLEWAVESGRVHHQASALAWIAALLEEGVACFEAPLTAQLQRAWEASEHGEIERLNADFLASRESSELRAETLQMGYSLRRLLHELDDFLVPAAFDALPDVSFPVGWALAADVWRIPVADSLTAYLWSWCENQAMAALKVVPLGQTAGQRILMALGSRLPAVVERALALPEERWSNFAPGLALACSCHETQYTRLFRS
jgi:urease accessory protein